MKEQRELQMLKLRQRSLRQQEDNIVMELEEIRHKIDEIELG
jgi:hypothetical protein